MGKAAERRQNLRDALIRAAEHTISREGLAGLRARDLAKEVGCALGAIYNVFPDLDALVLAVNARTLAAFDQFLGETDLSKTGQPADLDPAVARLVRLAMAYLDFAVSYGLRWRALFEHRMAGKRQTPAWYIDAQKPLFSLVEEPLRELRPELDQEQRRMLARSSFAAVHGIVHLGLDGKLLPVEVPVLRRQIEEVVVALGLGFRSASSTPRKRPRRGRSSEGRQRK
jgi:AcrR family transcriptional regulator